MSEYDQPDVSFIIPIYNTVKSQIVRCVNSVIKLSNITYEVLMIDDGSDKSNSTEYRKIADKYSFRYFYNVNKGVSYARNYGLQRANGKYVFFLDSDDYILAKNIRKKDIKSDMDLVIYQVKMNVAGQSNFQLFSLGDNFKNSTRELLKLSLKDGLMNWACGKLFKLSFLRKNNLSFDTNRISGEDLNFVIRILQKNPKVLYASRIVYVYLLDNKTNVTRILRHPKRVLQDIIAMLNIRLGVLQKNDVDNRALYLQNLKEQTLGSMFEVYAMLTYYHRNNFEIQKQLNINMKNVMNLTSRTSLLLRLKSKLIETNSKKITVCYVKARKLYRRISPFKL